MNVLCLALLVAAVNAQPPEWYPAGACGTSQYSDAGEGCPLGTPCAAIIGGTVARQYEFPFVASLRDNDQEFCAGVVINDRWIITAAQCTYNRLAGDFQVVVGANSQTEPNPLETTFDVEVVIEHEFYDPSEYDHDISVVKTTAQITFGDELAPACAPDDNMTYEGSVGEIIGWGSTEVGTAPPDEQYYTSVEIFNNTHCQTFYGTDDFDDGMLCASEGPDNSERDTCDGDSGGPVAVKSDGVYSVVGLTSWGFGCASGYPGVFNRVGFYNTWITDKITKN